MRTRDGKRPQVVIDGFNLGLEKGTGVATYGRNLSYTLRDLGCEVGVLYGGAFSAGRSPLLREIQFEPVSTLPDEGDPSRVTLRGQVRLAVLHTGNVVSHGRAQATLGELAIVRAPGAARWTLAPGEVDRTRMAAGIPPPRADLWPFVALGLVLVVLLVLGGWMIRAALRARRPGPP